MEDYETIRDVARAELVEKKSRFIGHVAHVESEEEAVAFLESVRLEHREARHNVFAYKLKSGAERASDDGEPQKTAGLPTLEVLRHSGLQDVIVVTTRYFGGTLLGTGGLVRAYTQAAQLGLEAAERVLVSSCVDVRLDLPYSLYDQVKYACGQREAKILDTSFTDRVSMDLRMLEARQQPLLSELESLLRAQGSIVVDPPHHDLF